MNYMMKGKFVKFLLALGNQDATDNKAWNMITLFCTLSIAIRQFLLCYVTGFIKIVFISSWRKTIAFTRTLSYQTFYVCGCFTLRKAKIGLLSKHITKKEEKIWACRKKVFQKNESVNVYWIISWNLKPWSEWNIFLRYQ